MGVETIEVYYANRICHFLNKGKLLLMSPLSGIANHREILLLFSGGGGIVTVRTLRRVRSFVISLILANEVKQNSSINM